MRKVPVLPPFDPEVIRAMARWPDVPRVYGWLRLDCRGAWRIRDEPITHARTVAFLARHYRADESGAWYVQNGPQQVYVALDYTPWIYRYNGNDGHTALTTHTGLACNTLDGAYLDDDGNLLLETDYGIGVLDDRDLAAGAGLMLPLDSAEPSALRWQDRTLPLVSLARADVPARFGFVQRPQ